MTGLPPLNTTVEFITTSSYQGGMSSWRSPGSLGKVTAHWMSAGRPQGTVEIDNHFWTDVTNLKWTENEPTEEEIAELFGVQTPLKRIQEWEADKIADYQYNEGYGADGDAYMDGIHEAVEFITSVLKGSS